jgi:hypothetical protein
MQRLLTIAICIYCAIYAFEGVVRYGLNLVGADSFIFLRDGALIITLIMVGAHQFLTRKLHPAFLVYFFIVLLHGIVFVANFQLLPPALLGAKVFLSTLAGAVGASRFMRPSRALVIFFMLLWIGTFVGVALDKFGVSFPWVALTTVIDDVQVDVGRDWQIEKEDSGYRAGGFTRSSIHAANIAPLLALILIFNLRWIMLRLLVGALSLPAIYWTTQKGSLVAYAVVAAILAIFRQHSTTPLKGAFLLFLLLAIALPLTLPGYHMNEGNAGGFSNMSFNLRVEMMWPQAWIWINQHGVFPFGVGLGGISGGMQLFARENFNAADNIFIFMYAYFGMFAIIYLCLTLWAYFRVPTDNDSSDRQALATLLFIIIYGCVLSMLEDQMTGLFFGAALGWIAYGRKQEEKLHKEVMRPLGKQATTC